LKLREQIEKALRDIEEEHRVEIIWAAEAGSRAWGFESVDSDYDVRFIYHRPVQSYLRVTLRRDVIEKPGKILDISGWDLDKTLKLLGNSNPALLEWLNSPIVYHSGAFGSRLVGLSSQFYNLRGLMCHYLGMALKESKDLEHEFVKTKKYLYVIRSLLACRWVYRNQSIPPVRMEEMMSLCSIPWAEVGELIHLKRSEEGKVIPKHPLLNEWVWDELQWSEQEIQSVPKRRGDSRLLDEFMWSVLLR
jgi:predicted nucleotidyltransferase